MYQVKDGEREWTGRFVGKHTQNRGGREGQGVSAGRWMRQVIPSHGISVIELWGHPLVVPARQLMLPSGPVREPYARVDYITPELVFLNVYGAPESIPRNEFRQPM